MRIICKTTLLPREVRRGTTLTIRVTDDQPVFGILKADLADGHPAVIVDWGDGTVEPLPGVDSVTHTYAKAGTYCVTLSDDIASFGISTTGTSPFCSIYAKCLLEAESNAANLTTILRGGFRMAENLSRIALEDSSITLIDQAAFMSCTSLVTTAGLPRGLTEIGSAAFNKCTGLTRIVDLPTGLTTLNSNVFRECTGLSGRIDLPMITNLLGAATVVPFVLCTGGITEFHFRSANESAIRASAGFNADNTLGTGTAICKFDLP